MNQSLSITNMRIFATIAVVIIHASAPLLYSPISTNPSFWWWGNLYDGAVRWCVPLFFMISGALLIGKEETISEFYKKRVKKILIPFLFWSLFYLAYQRITQDDSFFTLFQKALDRPYYHLWFLYAILGLYLITPFLQLWMKHTPKRYVELFLGFWFVSVAVIPLFEKIMDISIRFDIPLVGEYVGYYVFGYYLNSYQKRIPFFLFPIGIIATWFGTFYFTQKTGKLDQFFYSYVSWNTIFASTAIFSWFQRTKFTIPKWNLLDRSSFGVYLVHAFVLDMLGKHLQINCYWVHPAIGIPVTVLCTLILSYLFIEIIRKIPIFNRII